MIKSTIHISGRSFELNDSNGSITPIDAPDKTVDIRMLSPGEYSIIIDGRTYHVFISGSNGRFLAMMNNSAVEITQERLRDVLLKTLHIDADSKSSRTIQLAPMPGLITKILKMNGTHVEQGEGVMIIEAMKMENEITAHRSGTIQTIDVKELQTVEKNDHLFTIETT
jgi:pyruvate carboxylase subunit B